MPTIRMPDNRLVAFPDDMPKEEILGLIRQKYPDEFEPEERTVLGQIGETAKAIPRGFGRTLLSAAEGAAELADAVTNKVGLENLIDSGDDNALVAAARQGQKAINDSFLGADDLYQDAWLTKFGEGLGSMATFLTPGGALKLAGIASTPLRVGATGALASTQGVGEAVQRVQQARDEGLEVTGDQEDNAALFGALVGLSELAPVERLFRGIRPVDATDDLKTALMKRFSSALASGGVEGLQEVVASASQDLIERGIYNPDADFGEGAIENLTIGSAVGFTADLVLNAMAGRRNANLKASEEANELAKRDEEAKERAQRREQYRRAPRAEDIDVANIREKMRQSGEPGILKLEEALSDQQIAELTLESQGVRTAPPEAVDEDLDPATIPPQSDDMASYAREIATTLGRNFPTDTSFTIEQISVPVDETTSEPAFQVFDSKGQPYGSPRLEYEDAVVLAGSLNQQIVDQTSRNTVEEVIETTDEQYDDATTETLEIIGKRIKNPRSNEITADAVNVAAGTTLEKGYDEGITAEAAMRKNMGRVFTEAEMNETLTASQRINRKRLARGLPETTTFTVDEARDVLGDDFGRLGDIGAGGIVETQRYTVGKDRKGNPVVVSDLGEVITTKKVERFRRRDGKPYTQKRKLKTESDARILADRLNSRYDRSVDEVVFEDLDTSNAKLKSLLEKKNIPNELGDPAIKTMAKAFVGKENVEDMDAGERKFFYQKIRKLPVVPSPLKQGLPDFDKAPTLTKERRSPETTRTGPLDLPAPDPQLASQELIDDMQKRLDAELSRKNLTGKDVTGRIFAQFRKYGVNQDGEAVIDGEVIPDAEGAYLKDFNEVAFGIQQVLAGKDVDMNDPDAVFAAIKDVLNHETVHALRNLDLFTSQEYQVLEKAAQNTKRVGEEETYFEFAQRIYKKQLDRTGQMEEAIAELVRQNTDLGGRPRSIINKIKDFLESVARWIVAAPPTVKSIVRDIESGRMGRRTANQVRTARLLRKEAGVFESEALPESGAAARTRSPQGVKIADTLDQAERELQENHWAGDDAIAFSKTKPPENSVKAYKLFKVRPNNPDEYFPLFVLSDKSIPVGEWVEAKSGKKSKKGGVKSSIGSLAYRPGWHAGDYASSTHIGGKATGKGKEDYRKPDQVWAEVELADDYDWQEVADSRARIMANGLPDPETAHITDQIPKGGYYRYKTNPNMTGNWLIGGDMKINRVLSETEVKELGLETGVPDLPSLPELIEREGLRYNELAKVAKDYLKRYYPNFFSQFAPKKDQPKRPSKKPWFQDDSIVYSLTSGELSKSQEKFDALYERRMKFLEMEERARQVLKEEELSRQQQSRRQFLRRMVGAGIGGAATITGYRSVFNSSDPDAAVVLGRAQPVSEEVLNTPLSDEAKTIYQAAASSPDEFGVNGAKALREILSNPAYFPPEVQALAADVASLLPRAGIKLAVGMDNRRLFGRVNIESFPPTLTLFGDKGFDVGTIIHEALHVNVLSRWRTLSLLGGGGQAQRDRLEITPEENAAYVQFEQVYKEFQEATASDLQELTDDRFAQPRLTGSLEIATSSMDEFFVRSLTDPYLQDYMSKKVYRGKTLLERFKDWITKTLFGAREGIEASWLDASLVASNELAATMVGRTPDYTIVETANRINGGPLVINRSDDIVYSKSPIRVPDPAGPEPILPIGEVEAELQALLERTDGNPTSKQLSQIPGAPTPRKVVNKAGNKVPDKRRDSNVKPTSLAELRAMASRGLEEGANDLFWYDQFANGLKEVVGDANIEEASVIFGITSQQNSAEQNLADTLHIMSVARRIDPVKQTSKFIKELEEGKRPEGQGLKVTGDQIRRIVRLYNEGYANAGLKTSTYMQLIQDRARNKFNPFSVQDVHMARAFGFRMKKDGTGRKKGKLVDDSRIPGDLQYRYAQYLTSYLANEFNVTPNQMQAALWFVAKDTLSPKDQDGRKKTPGTWASSKENAKPEIEAIEQQVSAGQFDKNTPLTPALAKGVRPRNAPKVASNPYTNHIQVPELETLAAQRAPRAIVSSKPGNSRGYGFPAEVSLDELIDFNEGALDVITDQDGQIPFIRQMGISHTVEPSFGSYEGVEPNIQIRLLDGTIEQANLIATIMGDALLQDAVVTSKPDINSDERIGIAVTKADGTAFTPDEIRAIAAKANPDNLSEGLNFTAYNDNAVMAFLDGRLFDPNFSGEYTTEMADEFGARVENAFDEGVQYVYKPYREQGEYYESEGYYSSPRKARDERSVSGSSDILSTANDTLYKPFWDYYTAKAEEIGFTPENLTRPAPILRGAGITAPLFEGISPQPRSIPPAEIEMAVAENLQALRDTSYGNVPTYSVKASPEAQAVGRNPEVGAKPSSQQEILFSRKSPSDPQVKKSLDKVITEGSRKKSFLESIMPGGRHKEDDYKSEFSRFRQGFVNRYEPIEKMDKLMREKFNTLADSSALFAMFMADRSKNLTAASIKSGVPYYDKEAGIFRVRDFMYEKEDGEVEKVDGLMGVLRPLFVSENVFGEPLLEVFQAYAIAKRAKDINDSGRQSPVPRGEEDAYLAEMEAVADNYINPVTNKSYIREAYDKYQAFNNEVIEMMRSTGLITPQEADSWSRSSVYYPFYKDFENAPDAQTKQENAQGQKVNVDSILNIGTETSPTYLPQDKVGS